MMHGTGQKTCLQGSVAQGVSEGPRVRYGMVWRQLRDDHIEHTGLPSSMQAHPRGIIHHLQETNLQA